MPNDSPNQTRPFVLAVALDLADTASGGYALDQAARIALRIPNCQLHVIYVAASGASADSLGLLRHYVTEKLALFDGSSALSVATYVRAGEPFREIASFASELTADLVVLGTHKAPHLRSLVVGSTVERVMAQASCPVLVAGPKPKAPEAQVIVIEAPCPDCVQTRLATRGRSWWCQRHSEHHAALRHHHLYSYTGPAFEEHDSEVTATGVDPE
jgi:nucleotide-binding universal stress UspA family protein